MIFIHHHEILVCGVGTPRYQGLQLFVSWVPDYLAVVKTFLKQIIVNQIFVD